MAEHITDEQVEKLFKLADEIVRAPSRFTKDFVVENLALGVADLCGVIDRLRADQPELTDEWGIGTDYTDTTRSEQAVSDNLAEALHLLDIARIHRSPDVVSEELIVRKVSEWRDFEEGDDRG